MADDRLTAAQIPDEIAAEITAGAAGLHDPEPVRGRSESLRECLQRTPHEFAYDPYPRSCICRLGSAAGIHDGTDLLNTRAYVAAVLAEIREGLAPLMELPEIPEPAQPPDGVLGYLVGYARTDGGVTGVVEGVTHTTPMDLETARREARKHGVSSVRRWFPVELRRVDGD